jgi:pimeloyl-ACP methyl ester carboxylesterase
MLPTVTLFFCLALPGQPAVESVCVQAFPAQKEWTRTPNRTQAVVLIHGFQYHLTNKNVPRAAFRPWQQADSVLVKELGKTADVYTFAYGQNVCVDTIVKESKLAESVATLRKLGYTDIVLIGHSAGGIIARHFVEDNPQAGVTRVIQVCAPNGGSPLASLTAPKTQKPFLECLSTDGRKQCLEARKDKKVPDKVQFVCVIARSEMKATSDGVVPCACQWTADLQKQGIPAVCVVGGHREVVREAKLVETLAGLIREKQDRWDARRVEEAKKQFFGK